MLDDFTQFVKYFEKAFSGLKPIIAWALTALGCILFPDQIYLFAVMAVTGAALCDVITKWWSICRINGGYIKAIETHKLQSRALWDGTKVKIFSYLIVMILTGLSYRVVFLEAAGIFLASFVYMILFIREFQSNVENLIAGGAKLQWLLLFTRRKEQEIMRPYETEQATQPTDKKDKEGYGGRI